MTPAPAHGVGDRESPRIRNEVTPRLGAQRVLWVCGVLLFLVGLAQVGLRAAVGGPFDWVGATLGGLQALCGLAQAAVARWDLRRWHRGEIVVTPCGITPHGGVRTRVIPWSTVVDVRPVRRWRVWMVRVTLTSGHARHLPAPMASVTHWNPRFVEHANTVHGWWQWYRHGRGGYVPGYERSP